MDGNRRYAGIDWAKARHAVCVVDERGRAAARFEVGHTDSGLRELVRRLDGVEGVAIERPDGPVVAALLEAGIAVFVIASRQVKALRARHGLVGNKDDRADAYVLADALRTDGHRLRPLRPDAPETVALRAAVRARKDLIGHRTALAQQLAAHLALAFPGAVDLFDELASPIARAFLRRFPTAERAAWPSPRRFEHWLAGQGYSGRRSGAELHARLVAAPAGVRGPSAEALAAVTLALVAAVAEVDAQAKALEAHIVEQLGQHPDRAIFTSLPRAGQVRAAALTTRTGSPQP
jgi:transposase